MVIVEKGFFMPEGDINDLRDQSHALRRLEATERYSSELRSKLDQQYPTITPDTFEAFQGQKIVYGAIKVASGRAEERAFFDKVLMTALDRAANPEDAAFCEHG